jgi:DNA polymerase III subunit epsilon
MNGLNLAIIDVETTGTSAAYDRIIEIGVLRIENGKLAETYSTLVDPERSISYHIQSLTGITNGDLVGAPTFGDIKSELLRILDGCVFVAHNARFDYGFVRHEFERVGVDFSARCLCSARLSRKLFPEQRRHSLDSIIQRFDIRCVNRHRALDDAQVIWDFLQTVPGQVGTSRLSLAVNELLKAPILPSQIDPALVKSLPDSAGVYVFYGHDRNPLYVGKSINIRSRVLSHFSSHSSSSKEMSLWQQVEHIEAISTAGELGALLLESHLIKDLYPLYNRRSLNSKRLVVVRRVVAENGYMSAVIEPLNGPAPSNLTDIVAIFRTQKKAKDFLWENAREHGLCPSILGLEKRNGNCCYVQLDICRGACAGREAPSTYNRRFIKAFAGQGIKSWPFPGPILVEEKNGSNAEGEAFVIDRWCLVCSFKFDETGAEKLLPAKYVFDYDSYKILSRFLVGSPHRSRLKQISHAELEQLLNRFASP